MISTDGTVLTTETYPSYRLDAATDFAGIETWLFEAADDERPESTHAPTVVTCQEPDDLTAELQWDIEVLQDQFAAARDDLMKKDYQSAEILYREIGDALQTIHTNLRPFRMEMIQYHLAECLLLQRDAQKLVEAQRICESVIKGLILPLNSESASTEGIMVDEVPLLQQVSFVLAHLQYLQSDFERAESTCKKCLIAFRAQERLGLIASRAQERLERQYGLSYALMSRILEKLGKQGPARIMLQRVPDNIDRAEIGEPLCVDLTERVQSLDITIRTTARKTSNTSDSKQAKKMPRESIAPDSTGRQSAHPSSMRKAGSEKLVSNNKISDANYTQSSRSLTWQQCREKVTATDAFRALCESIDLEKAEATSKWPSLYWAIAYGDLQLLQSLINTYRSGSELRTTMEDTQPIALVVAAWFDQPAAADLLLDYNIFFHIEPVYVATFRSAGVLLRLQEVGQTVFRLNLTAFSGNEAARLCESHWRHKRSELRALLNQNST